MRIAIGSDHRGFDLKEGLYELLGELGHEWVDIGCQGEEPVVDYPDIARPLAQAVARGELDVGILICLTREDEKGLYAVVPDLPEAVRNPSRPHCTRLVRQEAVGEVGNPSPSASPTLRSPRRSTMM